MLNFRVLIVDDEADIRECLPVIAQHEDIIFECAPDGEAGLRRLLAENFDCVVSDVKMPQMNGIEMLGRARAAGHETPMVLISAFPTQDLLNEVKKFGAVKILNKLDILQLKDVIIEAIALRGKK